MIDLLISCSLMAALLRAASLNNLILANCALFEMLLFKVLLTANRPFTFALLVIASSYPHPFTTGAYMSSLLKDTCGRCAAMMSRLSSWLILTWFARSFKSGLLVTPCWTKYSRLRFCPYASRSQQQQAIIKRNRIINFSFYQTLIFERFRVSFLVFLSDQVPALQILLRVNKLNVKICQVR